ncbi:MAG: hypothetical protein AAGG07_05485 [Planctomycetota bacterium]
MNPSARPLDVPDVSDLPAWFWAAFGIASFASIVVMLHCVSAGIRRETTVHDLRVRVITLRNTYVRQLRALRGDGDPDDLEYGVDVLDD